MPVFYYIELATYDGFDIALIGFGYEFECADFEWERILDLSLLAISQPIFLESEFEAEMGNVREELIQRDNDNFAAMTLAVSKQANFNVYTYQDGLDSLPNISLLAVSPVPP